MVGCSRDPSAEKYKLYHFVFQITSIDCSVRKVTCHQLSHWPAGKLLPVTPQCAETNGGAQARCVTIGDVTQFPQGVCLTEQVSWSAEMGRGSSMKGLNVGVGSSLPKMTTPALPARLHLPRPHWFLLFASKLPGPNPVYASKPYAKDFNILYIFSGSQKKRCSLEGAREKIKLRSSSVLENLKHSNKNRILEKPTFQGIR